MSEKGLIIVADKDRSSPLILLTPLILTSAEAMVGKQPLFIEFTGLFQVGWLSMQYLNVLFIECTRMKTTSLIFL